MEEFKRCIHSDVRTFIDEKKAETLEEVARLADEFSLSNKLNLVEKPRQLHNPPVEFRLLWCHNGLETRNVDRMTEKIQNRILLTTMQIVSAPRGHNSTGLIKIIPSSHQHVSIAEKVTWFPAAQKSGKCRKNKIAWSPTLIVLSLRRCLSAASEDTPSQVPRKRTQISPISEVSGLSKSFIDIFQPFIHDGSVSLSNDMSDSMQSRLERHWSLQVFTVEWHFVVFWEVVHWCECSNQRNQFWVYPSATSYSLPNMRSCVWACESWNKAYITIWGSTPYPRKWPCRRQSSC